MSVTDYLDPYDSMDDEDQPSNATCRWCGKTGLRWESEDGQWMLYEGCYKLHRCDMRKVAFNDFEVVQ